MMDFECEYCGWSIEGGDNSGIHVSNDSGDYVYDYWRSFNYCFHCGHKIEEPDSLRKIIDDMMMDTNMRGHKYIDRLRALDERGA